MRFDLDLNENSFNSRNVRPRRRPALYPSLRDRLFLRTACSRPARTRTRCAAAGQGDYFPRVITLPGGSAPCSANTTLLGCQAVGHCAQRRQSSGVGASRGASRRKRLGWSTVEASSPSRAGTGSQGRVARAAVAPKPELRRGGGGTSPSERKCFETGFFFCIG